MGQNDQDRARSEKERLVREVHVRKERHERLEREGEPSFWHSVGAMGIVGWSVALPAALGALIGRWLDGVLDSGHVFVVFFMLIGIAFGCWVAWKAVREHS